MKEYKRITNTKPYEELDLIYELGYSHIYKRLQDLENKLENGTLIELPCMHKTVFGYYRVTFFSKMFNCIDSELFFNKAEAEKKLAELKGEV
jgi:hypothetical protein